LSSDDDQLKAKIGQILYNNYITDRLREEILQRVAHRKNLALRMSLGRDSNGEEVFLDMLINRVRPEVEELKRSIVSEEHHDPKIRKYTAIILSSEGSANCDNTAVATNFEYLMGQSLNWWARYAGSRDNLNVDKWKIEHAYTVDTSSAILLVNLPVENITVPENRKFKASKRSSFALDSLPPISVRLKDNGRFELIDGYDILESFSKLGREEVPARILSLTDDEADDLFDKYRQAWEDFQGLSAVRAPDTGV
jgi:hypothetical protein